MKHVPVIANKNMPERLPLVSTAVAYLLLDRFHAPEWLWGVIGTVFFVLWVAAVVALLMQDQRDIFEGKL